MRNFVTASARLALAFALLGALTGARAQDAKPDKKK